MFITDKLSTELGVNYIDLFNKLNEYNNSENKKHREDIRLEHIFNHNEQKFLACYALEFLKQNGIDNGNKMNAVNIVELSDFADSVESERDELSTEKITLLNKVQDLRNEISQYRLIQYELAALLKKMENLHE